MRKMVDAKGVVVTAEFVRGEDAYAGMLEGTPYLARKFRLMQGQQMMKRAGTIVLGLDELEREIAVTTRDSDNWAPNERWTARLIGTTDRGRNIRRYLILIWYQKGIDPMLRLANLVTDLDFLRLSQEEPVDVDE